MGDVDIAERDKSKMFAEWQRRRIDLGGYEVDPHEQRYCVQCNRIIPLKRLLAVPNTNYCVDCLRRIENELKK